MQFLSHFAWVANWEIQFIVKTNQNNFVLWQMQLELGTCNYEQVCLCMEREWKSIGVIQCAVSIHSARLSCTLLGDNYCRHLSTNCHPINFPWESKHSHLLCAWCPAPHSNSSSLHKPSIHWSVQNRYVPSGGFCWQPAHETCRKMCFSEF